MNPRSPLRWSAALLVLLMGWVNAAEPPAPAPTATQLGPEQLVRKVAQETLRDLEANRAEYRKDPRRLRDLIDANMLPYFDTEYMGRSVLAVHWQTATLEQRQRFVDAFYKSLLRNYGEALLDFRSERLQILAAQQAPDGKTATVRSTILRDNGTPVEVNYQLRQTPQGWKAFDVHIEGVSYLRTYKRDFAAEISKRGLDAVIKRLEALSEGKPAVPAAPPTKS